MADTPNNSDAEGKFCPECKGTGIITDYKHGERICVECGFVLEEKMFDHGPEWREFQGDSRDTNQRKQRTGNPMEKSRVNFGMETQIGDYRDPASEDIRRIRKLQKIISNSSDRNFSKDALPEIKRMFARLNVSKDIKEECATLYRKAQKERLIKGSTVEAAVAAIFYLIFKKRRIPKTLKEISQLSGTNKKEILRSAKKISKGFSGYGLDFKVIDLAECHAQRIGEELNFSGNIISLAKKILKRGRDKGITGERSPETCASIAILLAASTLPENAEETSKKIVKHLPILKRIRDSLLALNKEMSEVLKEIILEEPQRNIKQ